VVLLTGVQPTHLEIPAGLSGDSGKKYLEIMDGRWQATITTDWDLGVKMNIDNLVRRVDELIVIGTGILATQTGEGVDEDVDPDAIRKFQIAMIPVIEEVYGYNHPLSKEFATEADKYFPGDAKRGIEALSAMRTVILYASEFGS
jgi:hypothetical protein